jgi:hypothetical protein
MKVYSASEAIWPALLRTYSYLFSPFQWESFLKLAAVATVCEGFVVSVQYYVPNTLPFEVDSARLKSFLLQPEFLPVTVLGVIALLLVGVYCLFLVTHLRFAFFHTLVHHTREFRPATRLYLIESECFFTASALVWLSFMVLCVLAVLMYIVAGYTLFTARTPDGKLDPGNFLILFIPCIVVGFGLLLAAFVAQVVLNDFILPHMAIEGTSFQKAWAEVRARFAANRETFLSFLILRFVLPIVGGAFLGFVAWIAGQIVFSLLSMSVAGFDAMWDGTGGARAVVLTAMHVLFLLLGFGAGCGIAVSTAGTLGVFMRSYALYFYGGHYKALGNLMEPQLPSPIVDSH